ncbi:MAG TPA: arginine deiminase-related protein, partial [Acidobacteriaceae bacterium]|nr:arginine deiminase-related protein [Acidobacteriaceae bacterium]
GYTVLPLPRELAFEGEGDALFSADGEHLWVGFGTRTMETSHAAVASALQVRVEGLRLVDPRFYHLDTCFAPLADGSLLYYPQAFDGRSREAIESYYSPEQRIAVSEADALCFACNAVNLGSTVVMNHTSNELKTALERRGFHVLQTALDEFLKAGGAAKCLVLKLAPHRHTPQFCFDTPRYNTSACNA